VVAVGIRRDYTAHSFGGNAGTVHSVNARRCKRAHNICSGKQRDARPPTEQGAIRYAATWETILSGKGERLECSSAYPNKGYAVSSCTPARDPR